MIEGSKLIRRWTLAAVILTFCVFGPLGECRARSADHVLVKYVGRIAVGGPPGWLTLQDVDDRGRVLVIDNNVLASAKRGPGVLTAQPILLIWNLSRHVFSYRLPLDLTVPLRTSLAKERPWSFQVEPRQFRFLLQDEVVGTLGCYVVRLDLAHRKARWILPSPNACEPHPPYLARRDVTGPPAVLSVNRQRDEFAVGVNVGPWPRLFVFGRDADKPIASWRLSRPVTSLAWSPDGARLAVLYNSRFDAHLKYFWKIGYWRLPNLVVFDVPSGKQEFAVFTGEAESHVEFSKDGSLLYVIAQHLFWGLFGEEGKGIKVFSAFDGKKVRNFKGGRHGVRTNFALSPDGKLIVADASTQPFSWEGGATIEKIGRFVILDSASGRVLFSQPGRRMDGSAGSLPFEFVFTPDGRTLLADPNSKWGIPGSDAIDIYSVITR